MNLQTIQTSVLAFIHDEDGLTIVEYAVAGGLITLGRWRHLSPWVATSRTPSPAWAVRSRGLPADVRLAIIGAWLLFAVVGCRCAAPMIRTCTQVLPLL